MQGVNAKTGKRLAGNDHLRQSVIDILSTPKTVGCFYAIMAVIYLT